MKRILLSAAALTAALATPRPARAFCGFYVSGGGAEVFNNATEVVMMRVGTRTVLSMQNNYQGPPTDFAMVVPVPVVLKEENVKTLPKEVFQRVDKLGSPRLVEYWEQDPCEKPEYRKYDRMAVPMAAEAPEEDAAGAADLGVKIEAKFAVAEYQVVILSAKESTGLDTWLHQEGYKIPDGAEPYLRPYVETGMKFFVAKVDPKKVKFTNGMAMLSPLRFYYDTPEFALPIRLGMMNSAGTQDLIVNILAPGQRYEVANYGNVFIPTNLDVKDEVRKRFGEFYAALFDKTAAKNPGAVVTEYSWDASSCDPCPEPALDGNELATLGADVTGNGRQGGYQSFVLTRLHARYSKDGIDDDLVFKAAPPVVGGREIRDANGNLEERAKPASYNNFQGRYAIRHEWTGPIECLNPIRGRWGGPPAGQSGGNIQAAQDLAFAPRGKVYLPAMVAEDVPEIGVVAGAPPPVNRPVGAEPGKIKGKASGCGGCATSTGAGGLALVLMALVAAARRRG